MHKVFPAPRFILAFILILSSLSFFPSQAAAQADPPQNGLSDVLIIDVRGAAAETEAPASPRAITKISGIVINAVTGEPLPRALVTIESEQLATLTGADGRFEFSRVGDSQAIPSAEKPGFLNDSQAQPESFPYGIPSTVVQNGTTFMIPLMPAGILTGRVVDSNGDPMEGVVVTPIASIVVNGRRNLQPRLAATTRKDGVFRIDSMPPGSYFLEVALGSRLQARDKRSLPSLEAPPGADYPPLAFYPGVTDLTAALALDLRPGATIEADFTLAMVPAFRVSGKVTDHAPQQYLQLFLVHPSGQKLEVRNHFDANTGTFTFPNVPAGEYRLVALCEGCNGSSKYGETPVIVSSQDVRVNVAVRELGSIKAEITEDSSQAPPAGDHENPSVEARLIPVHPLASQVTFHLMSIAGGETVVPNGFHIPPGAYRIEIKSEAPYHLASASYGGQNLLREELVIRGDAAYQRLQMVVCRDGATLSGMVQPESKPAGAVLLVPRSPLLPTRMAPIDKDNRYELLGIAPGDYDLFAFDQIDNLEYHDRSFLRAYEDRARHVSLHANQTESVTLDLISRRN